MEVCEHNLEWSEKYPILASEEHLSGISKSYGWVGGLEKKELVCFISYVQYSKATFLSVSLQHEVFWIKQPRSTVAEKEFLEACINLFRKKGIDFIAQPSNSSLFNCVPSGAIGVPFGSYVRELSAPTEAIWAGMHSKHRNVIRNAERLGVTVKNGFEHFEAAYLLIKASLERSRHSIESEESFFLKVKRYGVHCSIYVAYSRDGIPQASAILPFSRLRCYYLWGGTRDHPILGSANLLHWKAMCDMKMRGVLEYDFVGGRINPPQGSRLEGIQRFKERFGASFRTGMIWKMPLNKNRYLIYRMLASIYSMFSGHSMRDIVDEESARKND